MNPTIFAMRRPITVVMIIVTLLGAGALALNEMRVDIFPAINAPQIYVLNNYAGMDPSQIEGIITNVYELNFQYVDGLKGIESKNIQNMVMLKLTFYPGTDMAAAMSQVVSLANRARGQMPPSVLPPFVMRFDAANVPIGYLVLESKTRPLGELADLGMYKIRPMLIANLPGTISFSPFGSNTRAIVITVDPDRLRAHNFTPEDVVQALETGNVVTPVRQSVSAGADALGAHQRHGRRSAGDGQHSHSRRQRRLHPRRGHRRRCHGHQLRLCAGERPQVDLYPGGEERHRFDAHRGEPDP